MLSSFMFVAGEMQRFLLVPNRRGLRRREIDQQRPRNRPKSTHILMLMGRLDPNSDVQFFYNATYDAEASARCHYDIIRTSIRPDLDTAVLDGAADRGKTIYASRLDTVAKGGAADREASTRPDLGTVRPKMGPRTSACLRSHELGP
jgi:hypothetical protein